MGDIKTRFTLEGEQQYRSAMTQAANAVKVLNAQEKLAKAQFEQTGNAEKYAAAQADILRQKITQQKSAVAAAEKALKQLSDNGVSPSSKQFQQWQMKLTTARTSLTRMETDLNKVTETMNGTAAAAEKTGEAVDAIGKKVSFDGVIGGISKITGAMQAAAGMAIDLGKQLGGAMLEAASWADDLATDAIVYGLSQQQLQQMTAAAWKFDTSVESIVRSQQKLENNMVKGSDEVKSYFDILGVAVETFAPGKYGSVSTGLRDVTDVFWDVGAALMNYGDAVERDVMAQAIFGRSWRELLPMFTAGREEYEAFMEGVDTNSDETINNLLALDDSWHALQDEWNVLKRTVLGELAPSFTTLSDAASGLLKQFNEYLNTDEGKEKIQALGEAVTNLFDGITEEDFGTAMDVAKGAIDSLTNGLEWIKNNWSAVEAGLKALGIAFGTLKISEGVLTFLQLLASGKFLFGGGGGGGGGGSTVVAGGGGLFSTLRNAFSFTGKVAPFVAPIALLFERMAYNQQIMDEATAKGAESILEYQTKSATYDQNNPMYNLWDMLTKATTVNGDAVDREKLQAFAQHYMDWFNEGVEDAALHELTEGMTDEQYDNFHDQMLKILSGEMFYSNEDEEGLMKALEDAIGVAEGILQKDPVQIPVTLPDGAEEFLQGQLNQMGLGVIVNPTFANGLEEEHANGLPYVPFDGYRAVLHKGERVLTAREVNNSRNFSSNLYVENMNMNGASAEGLAATMAAAQRRMMRGYGS